MKVLILGGNGYLGSKLAAALVNKSGGDSVICTQRTGSDSRRLNEIKDSIHIIPSTVDSITTLLQYEKIDAVFNMVCNYSRSNLLYDSVLDANIVFPLNVLNLITEMKIKRYITIGTSLPDNLNMYSFSKAMLGEFGKYYAEKHDISFTDVRLEMFYGSDEPHDRFIPGLVYRMLRGEPVDVTLGTQRRDILTADDAVRALLLILNAGLPGYQTVSVGTGIAPTVSEIVDFIWENTGKRSVINRGSVPMRENEPDCVADTSLLRSIGVWEPVGWKKGLLEMIDKMKMEMKRK